VTKLELKTILHVIEMLAYPNQIPAAKRILRNLVIIDMNAKEEIQAKKTQTRTLTAREDWEEA